VELSLSVDKASLSQDERKGIIEIIKSSYDVMPQGTGDIHQHYYLAGNPAENIFLV
jgi:hypothetical protein